MIKQVIFDFGDVIARFHKENLTAAFTKEETDRKLLEEAVFARWEELDAGTLDYETYQKETLSNLPDALRQDAERFFEHWYQAMPLVEGIPEFIRELKSQGYGLYILSNASVYFAEKSPYFGVHEFFDGIVFSGCVKMTKPNSDIYRYLLDTYRLNPEECLFLDDRQENIEGAKKEGIHGLVFTGEIEAVREYLRREGLNGSLFHT